MKQDDVKARLDGIAEKALAQAEKDTAAGNFHGASRALHVFRQAQAAQSAPVEVEPTP